MLAQRTFSGGPLIKVLIRACTHKRGHWANVPLLEAPHKPTEKFGPVPPVASTIDHAGETRLGARDRSCIRPAIGTQTPWHDICWLQLSLDLQKHFLSASPKRRRGLFYRSRRCNRSAIFEGIGWFGTSPYSFRTSFPMQILKARATWRSLSPQKLPTYCTVLISKTNPRRPFADADRKCFGGPQ